MDKFWKKKTKDKKKTQKRGMNVLSQMLQKRGTGSGKMKNGNKTLKTENLDTELTLFTRITFLDLFLPKIIGMYSEVVNATTPMTTQI